MNNSKTDNGGSGAGLSTSLSKALLDALHRWRSAEIHWGAIGLGLRQGNRDAALEQADRALGDLRSIADKVFRDRKDSLSAFARECIINSGGDPDASNY